MTRILTCLTIIALAFTGRAVTPEDAQKLLKDTTPSLVAVQYTYEGELGRRDFAGSGLVVSTDGLVMASLSLTPPQLPDIQMKNFKIIIPGDDLTEIDATFVGRDERSGVSFIKANPNEEQKKKAPKWAPVKFVDEPVNVGDEIFSVGILGKTASYQSYFAHSMVAAILRGEVKHMLVTGEGLTAVGSPVFNKDFKAIGWVNMQAGQSVTMNDPNPQAQLAPVYAPPRMFIPTKEFAISLSDPPIAGKPLEIPWLGAQTHGVSKDVADYYDIAGQPAVEVGDVIKDSPAEKAGLKPKNIIIKLNGKALERGDEPDEVAMILMKDVRRMKPGAQVTFSVITEKDKPAKDLKVTLATRPKQENQAKRFYAEDLGFTSREIVFEDTYVRKLPADQKGVVIALVKPASAAQTAKLQRNDLATQINQTAITDVDQFKKVYQDIRKANPKEAIVLEVIRQGNNEIIRIEPPQ